MPKQNAQPDRRASLSRAPAGAASLESRLGEVHHRITTAAADAGREPQSVTLVCISKTHPAEAVEAVIGAGECVFGENRVQEAKAKFPPLKRLHPDLTLHLVGPLQTNKVREALDLFDVIETLDRPKLARALADEIARSGRCPRLYVEVNTGAEPQKAGILPDEADAFIAACRQEYGLEIDGLMGIPPIGQQASPHFALLAKIARRNGLGHLSMGMSADFELAIQLGATHVRIGTAIFGERG